MNNKKKNIFVWVFTWAVLLLVVLYSPIGSPDLYSSSDYYAGVPNADLGGSNIGSSPNFNAESGSDYNELNVPDYSSAERSSKSSAGYSYAVPASDNASSSVSSYSASESEVYQNLKNSSSTNTGGGSTFISNNGSHSDASSVVSMNSGGITTLSTNLSMNSAARAPKSPGTQYNPALDGGQHPGNNPDQSTRAPISDGWVFLLLLAASYGIIKKRFFTNE